MQFYPYFIICVWESCRDPCYVEKCTVPKTKLGAAIGLSQLTGPQMASKTKKSTSVISRLDIYAHY